MLQFINYRMRITLDDKRTLVGRFLAFDKHMNIVLADCEEFRKVKKTDKQERRALGLLLLRGECVVSIAVETPPPPKKNKRTASMAGLAAPPDRPAPMGRGMPAPGLAGPAPGLGGPSLAAMQPQLSSTPQMYQQPPYGRGAPPAAAGYGRGAPPIGMPPPAAAFANSRGGPPMGGGYGRGMVR